MMVVYRLAEKEFRPAMIVKKWSEYTANLIVFLDGFNDMGYGITRMEAERMMAWRTSAKQGPEVGEWQCV